MRILELSGDTGSTYLITHHLSAIWQTQGHHPTIIAPVSGRLPLRALARILTLSPRPHIIHAHLGHAAILGRMIAALFNIPLLVTLHGFQKARHYQKIRHFTAVSHAVKAHFVAQGIPDAAITVIHNGYPAAITQKPAMDIRAQLGITPDRILLGSVGTLSAVKQQHLMISAMPAILAAHPQALLLIAGTGDLRPALAAQIQSLNLQNHVRLLGFTDQLAPFYHALDLYLQTSREEGFCLPLLEAMACGVAVISTASGGPQEYIRDQHNGIILPAMDAECLARSTIELLSHPQQRQSLAAQAARDVQPLSWQHQAAQYETILQGLLP